MTRLPLPRRSVLLLALAAAAAVPGDAAAQSILASRGLGYPYEPLDARARGVGAIGVGLPGPQISLVNPASAAGLRAPAIVLGYQPDTYDAEAGSLSASGSTARFPLLAAAFPIGRAVLSVGYGAFLDRNWRAEQADSLELEGGRVPIRDRYVSMGGISRLRFGAGYLVTSRLAVGAAADVFTGAVRDSTVREFGEEGTTVVAPFVQGTTWGHRGVGGALGVRWTPTDALNLAAAVSGGGSLEAEPDSGSGGKSYSLPTRAQLGASGRIGRSTTVSVAGRWAGWSATDDELSDASGGARDVRGASAGVEYIGFTVGGRIVPLRAGGRYDELPFRWGSAAAANEFPTERAVGTGLGLRLAGGAAVADAAAEVGMRGGDAAGFDESFWRLSFSVTLNAR